MAWNDKAGERSNVYQGGKAIAPLQPSEAASRCAHQSAEASNYQRASPGKHYIPEKRVIAEANQARNEKPRMIQKDVIFVENKTSK